MIDLGIESNHLIPKIEELYLHKCQAPWPTSVHQTSCRTNWADEKLSQVISASQQLSAVWGRAYVESRQDGSASTELLSFVVQN